MLTVWGSPIIARKILLHLISSRCRRRMPLLASIDSEKKSLLVFRRGGVSIGEIRQLFRQAEDGSPWRRQVRHSAALKRSLAVTGLDALTNIRRHEKSASREKEEHPKRFCKNRGGNCGCVQRKMRTRKRAVLEKQRTQRRRDESKIRVCHKPVSVRETKVHRSNPSCRFSI